MYMYIYIYILTKVDTYVEILATVKFQFLNVRELGHSREILRPRQDRYCRTISFLGKDCYPDPCTPCSSNSN